MLCEKCGAQMRKVQQLNSGNGVYHTFQCTRCMHRKMLCMGMGR